MSIVAMKRKSRRYKAVVSGRGSAGFSLNGGHRNQGWVGQGVRGRSLGGTRFRGAEPMGSGGTNGTYKRSIVNGGRPCTNDPSIIKRSSSNTPGLISSRLTPRGAVPEHTCCERDRVEVLMDLTWLPPGDGPVAATTTGSRIDGGERTRLALFINQNASEVQGLILVEEGYLLDSSPVTGDGYSWPYLLLLRVAAGTSPCPRDDPDACDPKRFWAFVSDDKAAGPGEGIVQGGSDFFAEAIDSNKAEELGKLARSVCDPFAGGVVQLGDNGTSIVPIITISCSDVPKSVRRGPPIQNIPGTCCTTGPIWVQGDTYNAGLNSSQSSRIDKIKRKAATCVTLKSDAGLDRCGQGPDVGSTTVTQTDCCGRRRVTVSFDPQLRYYVHQQASRGGEYPAQHLPASIGATVLAKGEKREWFEKAGIVPEDVAEILDDPTLLLDTDIYYDHRHSKSQPARLLVFPLLPADGGWVVLGREVYVSLNLSNAPHRTGVDPPPPSITEAPSFPLCPSQPDNAILRSTEGKPLVTVTCVPITTTTAATYHQRCKAASYHIGGKKFVRTMYSKNLNGLAVDQSQYMYSGLMAKNDLPTPPCKAPFPSVGKANKWCGETYTDPELAKAAGLLSMDWGDCKKCGNPGMMYTTSPGTSQHVPVQTPLRDHTIEQRASDVTNLADEPTACSQDTDCDKALPAGQCPPLLRPCSPGSGANCETAWEVVLSCNVCGGSNPDPLVRWRRCISGQCECAAG